MGKIIFWIVVFFVILLVLRLVNLAGARSRKDRARESDAEQPRRELPAEPTVRCVDCGTYLPKAEARPTAAGYHCGDPGCPRRR